jgi:hypothetical protein
LHTHLSVATALSLDTGLPISTDSYAHGVARDVSAPESSGFVGHDRSFDDSAPEKKFEQTDGVLYSSEVITSAAAIASCGGWNYLNEASVSFGPYTWHNDDCEGRCSIVAQCSQSRALFDGCMIDGQVLALLVHAIPRSAAEPSGVSAGGDITCSKSHVSNTTYVLESCDEAVHYSDCAHHAGAIRQQGREIVPISHNPVPRNGRAGGNVAAMLEEPTAVFTTGSSGIPEDETGTTIEGSATRSLAALLYFEYSHTLDITAHSINHAASLIVCCMGRDCVRHHLTVALTPDVADPNG